MDKVEIVKMIKTTLTRKGKGVEGDPIRIIEQYWDFDGRLLFEYDHFLNELKRYFLSAASLRLTDRFTGQHVNSQLV